MVALVALVEEKQRTVVEGAGALFPVEVDIRLGTEGAVVGGIIPHLGAE